MVSGLLALLAVTMGPGSGPERAADRYRVDLTIKQAADLTAAGMGMQEATLTASIFLNVTMSDTTGGRLAHVIVDSMTTGGEGQLAAVYSPELSVGAKGASIHAYIVNGRLEGTPKLSVEGNAALGLAVQGLNALFPGVSAKAAGKQSWSDTVSTTTTNEQVNITANNIVNWTVNSTQGNLLTVTGAGEGSVTGDQGGNQISGTVKNTLTAVTVIGGPSKSADLSSTQDMTVVVAQLPDPVLVKVNSTMKLTSLP